MIHLWSVRQLLLVWELTFMKWFFNGKLLHKILNPKKLQRQWLFFFIHESAIKVHDHISPSADFFCGCQDELAWRLKTTEGNCTYWRIEGLSFIIPFCRSVLFLWGISSCSMSLFSNGWTLHDFESALRIRDVGSCKCSGPMKVFCYSLRKGHSLFLVLRSTRV